MRIFRPNHSAPGARALIITALLTAILPVHAAEWQKLRLEGERLTASRKYQAASIVYQQALSMLPPNSDNERADLQIILATVYNQSFQIDKAVKELKSVAVLLKKLRQQRDLDPQVLVSLKTLIETCDAGYVTTIPYEKRMSAGKQITEAVNAICTEVYPQAINTKRKLDTARVFIANGDPAAAEKQLLKFKNTVPKYDPYFDDFQWSLAAVQQKLKRPQYLNMLANNLRKSASEPFVLARIARAQWWAADYGEAKKTLNQALVILKHKPSISDSEMVLNVYIDVFKDNGDEKGAEPFLRKRLALFNSSDGTKYLKYKHSLANCLRRQGKIAEADAIFPKKNRDRSGGYPEWEWFLTDKERADVAEAEAAGVSRRKGTDKGTLRK